MDIWVLSLIVITGIRHYIGSDFPSYVSIFNTYSSSGFMAALKDGFEPTISFIVPVLSTVGGTYQLMFLLYSCIIIGGYYYGCRFFVKNNKYILVLALLLYLTYNSTGGFWWGMNGIRQAAAMSIVFFFSKYLVEDKKIAFLFGIIIATLFHYSALVFFPVIFFYKKIFKMKTAVILLIIASIFTITGISREIVLSILSVGLSIIGKYEEALVLITAGDKSFSYMSLVYMVMYIFSMYECKALNSKYYLFIYNLSTVYIIMRVLTSFSLGGPSIQYILHRFEVFYLPFFLVHSAYGLYEFAKSTKPFWMGWVIVTICILILSYLSIINIAKIGGDTAYPLTPEYPGQNIEYDFNINLLE